MLFDEQEGCSKGGRYSVSLWDSMIDRSDRDLKLPIADNLHAAKVYDGSVRYKDIEVKTTGTEEGEYVFSIKCTKPVRPSNPPPK